MTSDMIHARQSHTVSSPREQEYLSGWQRERAELQNFRKRMQEQSVAGRRQALKAIIEPLLLVADNFQAMVKHVPQELTGNAWVTGVLHIARQVEQLLAAYNVKTIDAVDTPFDPTRHEAVEEVANTGKTSGHVIEIVAPGYQIEEEVVRPARVKIAK